MESELLKRLKGKVIKNSLGKIAVEHEYTLNL